MSASFFPLAFSAVNVDVAGAAAAAFNYDSVFFLCRRRSIRLLTKGVGDKKEKAPPSPVDEDSGKWFTVSKCT